MSDDIEHGRKYAETIFRSGVGASIVLAFFMSPLLQFMSYRTAAALGFYIALCLFFLIEWTYAETLRATHRTILAFMLAIGIPAAFAVGHAGKKADRQERRCLVIEREMMRGQPRRPDLPDVFQALGCRPQLDDPPRRPAM